MRINFDYTCPVCKRNMKCSVSYHPGSRLDPPDWDYDVEPCNVGPMGGFECDWTTAQEDAFCEFADQKWQEGQQPDYT